MQGVDACHFWAECDSTKPSGGIFVILREESLLGKIQYDSEPKRHL